MNRGRRGERIFAETKDYERFIKLLGESTELWQVRISAYCLMPNHYHILLKTPLANVSRCMRHINGVYTQLYNRSHGYDGQLFRGRYKAILVEEDRYLMELVRYIHRNPLRAGMVENLEAYPWSSHQGYLSSAIKWDWLDKNFILSMCASDIKKARQAYERFVKLDDSEEINELFTKETLPAILGSESFVDWAKMTFYGRKRHSQVPDAQQLAPDLVEIIKAVCGFYGVEEKGLLVVRRGAHNEARNVAIYLSRTLRQDNLQSLSRAFNMSGYSAAGSVMERVRKRLALDKQFEERVTAVKQILIT